MAADVMVFVVEHKLWFAVLAPIVVIYVVMKMLG